MPEDESTQPIDIEGLRADLASRPDESRPADDAQTETSIPIAAVVDLDAIEPAIEAVAAPPREPEPLSELPAFTLDEDSSPVSEDATRMGKMDDAFVRQAFAAAPHSEQTPAFEMPSFALDADQPAPSEDLDATRMRRMDDANIRQAFAAAESRETTAVFRGPVPDEAHPSIIGPAPPELLEQRRAFESGAASNVIEVDSAELESVDEVSDLDVLDVLEIPDGSTAEIAAIQPPAPSIEPETRMRQSSMSIEFTSDEIAQVDGGETAVSVRSPSASTNAQWQPPPDPERLVVPYHTVDADKEERELYEDHRWGTLLDLYRARMPSADTPAERAHLFHRLASVEEHGHNDEQKAFELLLQAFELDP